MSPQYVKKVILEVEGGPKLKAELRKNKTLITVGLARQLEVSVATGVSEVPEACGAGRSRS